MRSIPSNRRRTWDFAARVAPQAAQTAKGFLRWSGVLPLVIAVAAVTAWSDGAAQQDGGKAKTRTPGPIRVVECAVNAWEETVLAFDRPGILGKIAVQEGDTVEPGQFLATLKDDVARAGLAVAQLQADSDVEITYSRLAAAVAQVEHEKMVDANQKRPGVVPELEVRRAKLNHDKTLAELAKAEQNQDVLKAKRDEAAAQLDTYRLEAPFEGFVTRVRLVKGASVKQGDPVIELVNVKKVRVEGKMLVKDALLVQPGCKADVQLVLPDKAGTDATARVFSGKIVFVDLAKAELGAKVRVWAEVENPDKLLRAGMFATMTIQPVRSSD